MHQAPRPWALILMPGNSAGCTMAPACVVCLTMARPRRPPTLQLKMEVSALSFRRAAIGSRGLASGALARRRQAWPQRPGMSASITPPVDGFAVIGSEQGRRALPSAGLAAPFLIVAAKIPRLEKRGDSAAKDQASHGDSASACCRARRHIGGALAVVQRRVVVRGRGVRQRLRPKGEECDKLNHRPVAHLEEPLTAGIALASTKIFAKT